MRAAPAVRYIKAETICIGDTIKVQSTDRDLLTCKFGIVARREHYPNSTDYETSAGITLLTVFADGYKAYDHIVLLHRKATDQPTLEGINV